MPASAPEPVRSLSDTALLVALHRALETDRPDAVFRDRYARRLAGPRAEEVTRALPYARRLAWSTIVRTVIYDELICRCIDEGADTVLNLAAGLDSRPYRLDLPAALRWIEVDVPEIIAYKDDALKHDRPRCRLERVPLDLTAGLDRQVLFALVNASSQRVFVITEGLLVYLTPQDVASLAADLGEQPAFAWWALELASPLVVEKMRKHWGKRLEKAGAAIRFAPEGGAAFYKMFGWEVAEYRSFFSESRRLRREMPGAWLFRLMQTLAPGRAAAMVNKWESGVALLRPA